MSSCVQFIINLHNNRKKGPRFRDNERQRKKVYILCKKCDEKYIFKRSWTMFNEGKLIILQNYAKHLSLFEFNETEPFTFFPRIVKTSRFASAFQLSQYNIYI